jgi:hypothetical protein
MLDGILNIYILSDRRVERGVEDYIANDHPIPC